MQWRVEVQEGFRNRWGVTSTRGEASALFWKATDNPLVRWATLYRGMELWLTWRGPPLPAREG